MTATNSPITAILSDLHEGRRGADTELMPLVYRRLRRIAARHFAGERPGHTLGPTDLVHETYLRLIRPGTGPWENRNHFYAVASRAMRRILVDYARVHRAQKRDGELARLDWERLLAHAPEPPGFLLDLDRALQRLARLSPRQSRVVELRFFAGLTIQETAEVLGLGVTVVKQDWALARSWLQRELRTTP